MPTSFFQYEMLPTTWFYVSTLIILAMFFKFNRFWSVRNIDLVGLILLTPGLIFLAMWNTTAGYYWIFVVGLAMIVRLIFDTVMVRRPLLEPNLTPGGLTFACFFLVFFVVAALAINRGQQIDTVRTVRLEQILTTRHLHDKIGINPSTMTIPQEELGKLGPGFRPFLALTEQANLAFAPPLRIREEIIQASDRKASPPSGTLTFPPDPDILPADPSPSDAPGLPTPKLPTDVPDIPKPMFLSDDGTTTLPTGETLTILPSPGRPDDPVSAPRLPMLFLILLLAISGHLAIVLAFVYIGHCHFGNIRTGIACATLYLLHPYTNQMLGRLDHVIPAALILWAVAMYRRPFFSGLWIGTAAALVWYPICLIPLWCSFYSRRGWIRFVVGAGSALTLFAILLFFSPASLGSYGQQLLHLAGKSALFIFTAPDGFWSNYTMIYRVPLLAIFFALCFGMFLWPAHKHLATLLSCSALLMLGVQYWQLHQGGLFMAWYMPLLILTVFRPNLEDRVAQSMVVA